MSDTVPSDWHYNLPLSGERRLSTQPIWKTYPNAPWASVTAPYGGATVVYLNGYTAPKMVVVNGAALDYMANEFYPDPGVIAAYRFGIVLTIGERPKPEDSRQIADAVQRWVGEKLPTV